MIPRHAAPPKLYASNGSWVRRIAIILGSLATKVLSRRHTAIIGFVQVEFEFFRRNGVFDLWLNECFGDCRLTTGIRVFLRSDPASKIRCLAILGEVTLMYSTYVDILGKLYDVGDRLRHKKPRSAQVSEKDKSWIDFGKYSSCYWYMVICLSFEKNVWCIII